MLGYTLKKSAHAYPGLNALYATKGDEDTQTLIFYFCGQGFRPRALSMEINYLSWLIFMTHRENHLMWLGKKEGSLLLLLLNYNCNHANLQNMLNTISKFQSLINTCIHGYFCNIS